MTQLLTDTRRLRLFDAPIVGLYPVSAAEAWRSLALYLKALLDASASGIIDIREALMPYAVLPSGQTVAEHLGPQMQRAIETGQMPGIDRALGSGPRSNA